MLTLTPTWTQSEKSLPSSLGYKHISLISTGSWWPDQKDHLSTILGQLRYVTNEPWSPSFSPTSSDARVCPPLSFPPQHTRPVTHFFFANPRDQKIRHFHFVEICLSLISKEGTYLLLEQLFQFILLYLLLEYRATAHLFTSPPLSR